MEDKKKTTINYDYYMLDHQYKTGSRFLEYREQAQDFYEGKQIPENFDKNMPSFVANLCSYIINTKASKLRGTPYSIVFQSANEKSSQKLDKFDKFVLLDLQYDIALQQSIINMLVYGTEIVMYRFSDFGVSLDAVYEGKLVREHVDLRRFAVANPYLPSLQEQKWIMVWNYHDVKAVRDMCRQMEGETNKEFEARKERILPDDYNEEKYPKAEDIAHGTVCVYTRYFRINGEVCFQSSTKEVDLFDPTYMSPDAQKSVLKEMIKKGAKRNKDNKVDDYEIDPEPTRIEAHKDKMTAGEYNAKLNKFSLYPFAEFSPNRRFNHFYGISELQDVIPAQKVVNFLYVMSAKNIQDNAWGKWLVRADALRGQSITNNGGQVITDYSRNTNSWGVQRIEANSGNMLNITTYTDNIIGLIRTLKGANEVISGETASQLSGYAISLLQEQGNTVFEMLQSVLWNDFAVQEAKIRLQFYLHYYDKKMKFVYELDDIEYENERRARQLVRENDVDSYMNNQTQFLMQHGGLRPDQIDYPRVQRVQELEFSKDDISEDRYYIVPKAGRGIKYSEVVQADQINQLFKDGTIANLSVSNKRAYIELNPLIDDTTRYKYKRILEQEEQSQNAQLSEQVRDLTTRLEQASIVNQRLQNQLNLANEYVKDLRSNFSSSLNAAKSQNDILRQANTRMFNASRNRRQIAATQSMESDELISEGVNDAISGV